MATATTRTRKPRRTTAPFPFTVGDAFRRARLDAGLSPQEVADALGINYQTVLRWEKAREGDNKDKIPQGKNLVAFVRLTGATWLLDALERLASTRCYVDLAGHERELVAA